MDRLPVRDPQINWVEIDGEVVAVHSRSGEVHRLQGAAAVVWLLADGDSIGDLAADLSEQFGVELHEAATDLSRALALLRASGIVRCADDP